MGPFASLASYLSSIGLGSLFQVDAEGNPSGWLWDQVQSGATRVEDLLPALEQTPEFRNRFKVIFDMREQVNAGRAGYVPTVAQVLDYEREYSQLMQQAGVPAWFYDSFEDAQNAMRTNLAPTQIAERVQRGFSVVNRMPQEVRDVFAEYYGNDAEGALLAAVLDPQKTLAEIDRAAVSATFGGFSRRQGISISAGQATEFAGTGRSVAEAEQAAAEVARLRPLQETQYGESIVGVQSDAAFKAGALNEIESQQALESRLRTRQVRQSGVGGGAIASQSGITGIGLAE